MFKPLIFLLAVATLLDGGFADLAVRNIQLISSGLLGGCDITKYYAGCYNVDHYHCCRSTAPFCDWYQCNGCVVGDTLQAFNISDLSDQSDSCHAEHYKACANTDEKSCCMWLEDVQNCQVNFGPDLARQDSDVTNGVCAPVEPNIMGFTDEDGVQHEIHLPKGTFQAATQLFLDGNWTLLKTFPKWANQGYEDITASGQIVLGDNIDGNALESRNTGTEDGDKKSIRDEDEKLSKRRKPDLIDPIQALPWTNPKVWNRDEDGELSKRRPPDIIDPIQALPWTNPKVWKEDDSIARD